MNKTIDELKNRKSVRIFTDQPITAEQKKEILCVCINHENCPLDPVSCGCSIETTTFEDACMGKRTFIPGIECDK